MLTENRKRFLTRRFFACESGAIRPFAAVALTLCAQSDLDAQIELSLNLMLRGIRCTPTN